MGPAQFYFPILPSFPILLPNSTSQSYFPIPQARKEFLKKEKDLKDATTESRVQDVHTRCEVMEADNRSQFEASCILGQEVGLP